MRRILIAALLASCAVAEPDEDPTAVGALDGGDPAHDARYAVDVSHWEGPLSQYEMDCFWDHGVRHIVAGTQITEVTRQQLAMAQTRGMTVDAYVYLYWDRDPVAQVAEAFARADGFAIGRMWLDAEESPGNRGASAMIALLRQAVDACRADGRAECGIYTRGTYWRPTFANTTQFAELPLWYAHYDGVVSLDTWSADRFGGWTFPAAKQWAEEALCNVGVDKDSMQVVTLPAVVVDRTTPPPPTAAPAAPAGIYPADGTTVGVPYVKLMAASIPNTTSWQLALEKWGGSRWVAFFTWTSSVPFRTVYPTADRYYRLRVRASNAFGWGPWSSASVFGYGRPAGAPPGTPPPPPPPSAVPTGLAPDMTTVSTPSVTTSWTGVSGATSYELAIEILTAGTWVTYTTYSTTATMKTFWPQTHGTSYRFRVRAITGAPGAWSVWATFAFT